MLWTAPATGIAMCPIPTALEERRESAVGNTRLSRRGWSASAPPPCSDINLLGDRERIIDLDTKVSDSALDLRMPEQQLDCAQITSAPVDQSSLGSTQGMSSVSVGIQPDA